VAGRGDDVTERARDSAARMANVGLELDLATSHRGSRFASPAPVPRGWSRRVGNLDELCVRKQLSEPATTSCRHGAIFTGPRHGRRPREEPAPAAALSIATSPTRSTCSPPCSRRLRPTRPLASPVPSMLRASPVDLLRIGAAAPLGVCSEPDPTHRPRRSPCGTRTGAMARNQYAPWHRLDPTPAVRCHCRRAGAQRPVEQLAHIVLGALREAALFLAYRREPDGRREIGAVRNAPIRSLCDTAMTGRSTSIVISNSARQPGRVNRTSRMDDQLAG
jgi:hypothetical protein